MAYTLKQFIEETHFIPGETIIRTSCFRKEFDRHFEESNRAHLYIDTYCIWLESDFNYPERDFKQPTLLEIREFYNKNPNCSGHEFLLQEDDRCTPTEHEGMFYYPEHNCIVVY